MTGLSGNEIPEYVKGAMPSTAVQGTHAEEKQGRGSIDVTDITATSSDDGTASEITQEELDTLRRVSGKIPWSAYTIAFVELCERFSYYGTTVVCKSITLMCNSLV